MIRINEILDKVIAKRPKADVDLIQKAYVFSASAHQGQTRLSGEPYLFHPLEVANILAELGLDDAAIAAALLHDTVEDNAGISIEEVEDEFGEQVADIVDGVTKISQITFDTKEQAQAESIRKMILAMAEDIRVLILKLADRLHNMRTLDYQSLPKRQLVAQETLDIYAPLANRLGLHRVKLELEDLSFKYLKPEIHAQILQGVEQHQTADKEYVEKVTNEIQALLKKNKIKGQVSGRSKHLFSIYKKMLQQNLSFDQVYDLIAFRVIVDSVRDCYAVLGVVHSLWKPVPGRFKDYISMPKANLYQSLHSTVIGPDGERIEIQIRTEEMHQLAELGVASHWAYKEGGSLKPKDLQQFSWLRQILDWQKEQSDSREFIRSLRIDLFQDEVYVFTPKGQVKELPEGATPVDFAYMIHTEVGNRCAGAKVNGKLVPLSTKLQNGDTIEIIADPHRRPSRDWLKFVKTAKARTRITHYIRTEEREQSIALGREMLEKEGRKLGVNVAKAIKDHSFEEVAKEFSLRSTDDLISAVGYAKLTPGKILRRLLPREPEPKDAAREEPKTESPAAARGTESVRIKGVDDVLVRFAGCCNPLPGDAIVGYISRGRGVTVHKVDCQNVQGLEAERLLQVSWDGLADQTLPAKIRILARNKVGVLADISRLLASEDVNIDAGHFHSNVEGVSEMHFTLEVRDSAHLYQTIEKLTKVKDVLEVTRSSAITN